ncbi:hypothetical protein EDM56_26885 [Brevibacillus fluminis]|uniref:Uncharacterized protein n=1 Tax=Brevibacillus fluminis TaxID=511487 RepID=A0A3M8CZY0_9BACL|nr:hypothetical protein [Brevibacillus fluminis]RNB81019.1 hypothetical protein EDM56_26885 [Brevibacillus fluminis]
MAGDVISNLLDQLSKRTGRQWDMSDLLRLAQKLPELNDKNVDAVLEELSGMGLDVTDETKEKLKGKLADQDEFTATQMDELTSEAAKMVSSRRTLRKNVTPINKKRKE